jgi:hypothetical protein
VSQFSADMLVKYRVCRREKIFIAPNGHEHVSRWAARRAEIPLLKVGLAGNRDLRAAMAAHGRKRAALFSWKRSARLYLSTVPQRL